MFDVNEIEGKILLKQKENGVRFTELETDKAIYFENVRTGLMNKFHLTKKDDSAFMYELHFDSDRSSKTKQIENNGKICVVAFSSIITVYIKDNVLYIVGPEELKMYE